MSNEEINKKHEKTHYSNIEALERWIENEYERIVVTLGSLYFLYTSKPLLDIRIQELFKQATESASGRITRQIDIEWALGDTKNREYLENYFRGKDEDYRTYLKDNRLSLNEFKTRKFKGKTFVDRLDNYNKKSRKLVTKKILSYDKGRSQIQIRRELKEQLHLSEIIRLARAEVHDAYRMSDQVNWENNPFVIEQEIKVSDIILKHNRCEYCVANQGRYPKSFKWLKWHLNCMCYKIPVLMTPLEYIKFKETASMAG